MHTVVGVAIHQRDGAQGPPRPGRRAKHKDNELLVLQGRGLWLMPPCTHQAWIHMLEALKHESVDNLRAAGSGPRSIESGVHRLGGSSSRRKDSRRRLGDVPARHRVPGRSRP